MSTNRSQSKTVTNVVRPAYDTGPPQGPENPVHMHYRQPEHVSELDL